MTKSVSPISIGVIDVVCTDVPILTGAEPLGAGYQGVARGCGRYYEVRASRGVQPHHGAQGILSHNWMEYHAILYQISGQKEQ